jgi:hypothetical protein
MPGRSVPIRLSKLFVKVNDEELKNSRIREVSIRRALSCLIISFPRGVAGIELFAGPITSAS